MVPDCGRSDLARLANVHTLDRFKTGTIIMSSQVEKKLLCSLVISSMLFGFLLHSSVLAVLADESPFAGKQELNVEGKPATSSDPLYSADKPEWVAAPDLLDGSVHRISVSTDLLESEEACRSQLDSAILDAARRYVNQHLLPEPVAEKLSGLNAAWVRENWLVPNRDWMAELDRPSGTYHQLWGQLEIFPEDRQQVTDWYHDLEIRRKSLLCLLLCLSVGGLAGAANMGLRFWGSGTSLRDIRESSVLERHG